MSPRLPTVFIPALLCDALLYRDAITALGDVIEPHVLMSPQARFERMPQCGHLPALEQPARAVALFRAFLCHDALKGAQISYAS